MMRWARFGIVKISRRADVPHCTHRFNSLAIQYALLPKATCVTRLSFHQTIRLSWVSSFWALCDPLSGVVWKPQGPD